jgi:hypothetical protein
MISTIKIGAELTVEQPLRLIVYTAGFKKTGIIDQYIRYCM